MRATSALLLLLLSCLSGCAYQVPLSNNFLPSSSITGSKLPIKVGLFIEEGTKNFKEKIRPSGGGQVHTFGFPVGEELSKIILSASQVCFEKVEVVDGLPTFPSKDFDAYLIVKDLKADIQIRYANTGTAIAFGLIGQMLNPIHSTESSNLSVAARMVDANSNDLYSSTVVGKGSSDVPSSMGGIKPEEFSGGVNNAMQDLAGNLMTEILRSQQIKDYAAKASTR